MFGNGFNNFYPYSNVGMGMANFGGNLGSYATRGIGSNIGSNMGGLATRSGLMSGLKGLGTTGRFSWSGLLSGTQKTLNIVNQAIPVFYQVKPMWNNAKTAFKIFGAIKDDDKQSSSNNNVNKTDNTKTNTHVNNTSSNNESDGPNFFL